MNDFLETLKIGMQEARQKFETAQKKFTATQSEFQILQKRLTEEQAAYAVAAQEFQSYQTLVNLHTHKEQDANTIAIPTAPTALVTQSTRINVVAPGTQVGSTTAQPANNNGRSEPNKTEAVRDLLRQHPAGMTPAEIWKSLEAQLSNRAYLYSVLKRLRDKGDARERRGKYFLTLKPEENQTQVVQ